MRGAADEAGTADRARRIDRDRGIDAAQRVAAGIGPVKIFARPFGPRPMRRSGWKALRYLLGHPRKMGGPSAPDDLHLGCVTQAWLATSDDELARSTGQYFYHQRPRAPNPIAGD